MKPDISIVITSYNIETYIERAIHSALAQHDVSVEVIFIDDCSTDNTYAVATAIDDDRLTCLRLDSNGGPSVARNTGFAKASADWIAVLDGDDAYEPDRLTNLLKSARGKNADMIVDNILVRRESDGESFTMFDPAEFSKINTLDLATFIARNSSFFDDYTLGYLKPVFSKNFLHIHQLAYDPDIHIGEDYMMLANALACGAVCAVEPSAGYLYTVRAGSISHRLVPADLERMTTCDMKFYSNYTLSPDATHARRKREAGIRDAYAFTLLVQGLKVKNIKTICRALRMSPTSPRHLGPALKKRITKLTNIISPKRKAVTR